MIQNRNIKFVGVDLDGTLLRDDKTLCDGAEKLINSLAERGIHFVPITGRPYSGIPGCVKRLDAVEYIISSNGAKIMEAKTDRELFSFSLSNNKTLELISIMRNNNCMFEVFADHVGYAEKELYDYYVREFTDTPIGDYIFSSRKITPSLEALFEGTDRQADEVFIDCRNPQARDDILKSIAGVSGISHCSLGDRFLEILKQGTDKGEAMAVLCDYLGVGLEETIAFGDGENDLQFLEKAGVAVAMENAFPCIKEKADIITKSNNDNGVCEILKLI